MRWHWAFLLCVFFAGCSDFSFQSGAFGPPVHNKLLEGFQGRWNFDKDRTLALWKSQGVSSDMIAEYDLGDELGELGEQLEAELSPVERALLKSQGISIAQMGRELASIHPDLTFEGHIARGDGLMQAEYRLFGLHEHGRVVCGKAWCSEDANDPGDMSKCFVKIAIHGQELHLDILTDDEDGGFNDPDLTGSPAVIAASAENCPMPRRLSEDCWLTYVFVRPSSN